MPAPESHFKETVKLLVPAEAQNDVVALRLSPVGAFQAGWKSAVQRVAVGRQNAPAAAVIIGADLSRNEGTRRKNPGGAGGPLDAPHSDAEERAEFPGRGALAGQSQARLGI